jgi:hypothetical protein
MKKGQMLIITAVVILVSLGAVFMWSEGGITKEVTIGQTHAAITDAFSLGQTINNYLGDSAEISKCNAINEIIDNTNYMIGEETYDTKEDYFEAMFLYNFYIYMADFPKIKKTSLEDDYSLYNNLFFDIQFDYNDEGILEEIKGAPGWIEYADNDPFVDYLEIASEEGFVYKIKPIFSIDMNLDFEEVISPPECNTLIEESVPDEEVSDEEDIEETADDV